MATVSKKISKSEIKYNFIRIPRGNIKLPIGEIKIEYEGKLHDGYLGTYDRIYTRGLINKMDLKEGDMIRITFLGNKVIKIEK